MTKRGPDSGICTELYGIRKMPIVPLTPHTRLAENKEEGPLRWCPTLPHTKAAGPAEKLRNRLREPSLCSAICRPLCGEPIVSLVCPILSKGFGH